MKNLMGKRGRPVGYDYNKYREWYLKNAETAKLKAKQRYNATKEQKIQKAKEWREANKVKHTQLKSDWILKRMFYQKAMMLRHRKNGGKVTISTKQLTWLLGRLWINQRGLCALTGRRLTRDAHLDHIVPVSKNGTNDISNLQFLTPEVNQAKSDLGVDAFIKLCEEVLKHQESRNTPSKEASVEGGTSRVATHPGEKTRISPRNPRGADK